MDTYLLRRDLFVETMRFASIKTEPDPSLRNSVSREQSLLAHWAHMGARMYEASPGLNSEWVLSPDDVVYPERVLNIIERFRHTRQLLNPGPSFLSFASSYVPIWFFRAQAHWGTVFLRSAGSADGTDTG